MRNRGTTPLKSEVAATRASKFRVHKFGKGYKKRIYNFEIS